MPSSSSPGPQEARFVFKGTVQKLKAATMREITANDRTVVVRVDEVIQAPESLSHYAGQNITVLLAGKKKFKKGQQAVFYTNGVVYGDSIVVQSVDERAVDKMPPAMTMAASSDPVKNLRTEDIQARLATADADLSGGDTSLQKRTRIVA